MSPLAIWTDADDFETATLELCGALRFWRRWRTRAARHRVRQALAYLRAHRDSATV